MTMKRRQFMQAAGVAAASTAIAAPAIAQSAPEVKWRMTSSFPKTLDTIYGGADMIAKYCSEMTDGKFQIQPFAAGELVPGLQALDATSKTFAVAASVPFGLNCRQQNSWMYQNGGIELFNAFYKGYGVVGFPAGNTGTQMGGWFRKEIKTVADLQGLKFRIGGIAGQVLQKLGVVPQQIAGGDIYPALEKGTIDGAEWVGPYDDEKLGFNKVAPFYYYPGWWEGGPTVHAFFNAEKYNALPKAYQAILQNACALTNQWMVARYDVQNVPALKRLVQNGAQLRPYPAEVMEACVKATNELWGEVSAKNANFKKAIDAMTQHRNDQYLWWQVAEATFDNFMIRQRAKG